MIEMWAIAAFALMAAGAIAGSLVIFAIWIHREERAHGLRITNPGGIAGGLRAVMDARVHPRVPELAGRR